VSLLGAVRLERAYYHCRRCRAGHCPHDARLRLGDGALTAGAREAACLAGALGSFAEAAQKVLPKLAGLRLAESTVERAAEAAGADVGARLRRGETFGPAEPWAWADDANGDSCAYVSVDATGVGMQGEGGAKAEGRMAYVGLIFTPGARQAAGAEEARPARARVAAGLAGLADLGERMRRQAGQVGIDSAKRWVALTDGGAGLEEFIDVYFPRSECVLDFYHAAEHLNGLAKALRPGEEGAEALAGAWCHALKHRGPAAVLAELRQLDLRGRKGEIKEAHRLLIGYIEKNEHRMDYPRYQQEGLLIGSGHVEAACKAVVGQRMKGNGMRWGEAGADALCHLRALFKSEKGQWDAYWAIAA
jgi:hypothetical protein